MLKIGQPRNAYDILGLPRSATPVQVRARYRQLLRRYRLETPTSELPGDERFRRWTNAYLVLTGPERREYDRRLRESRGRAEPDDLLGDLPAPRLTLLEAEAAYARRKLNEAVELARGAVKQDSRNAQGYALLGDIFREQGKYGDALTMYNYAIQFEPNNRRYWQLLQEVTALREGRAIPRRFRRERPSPLNRPARAYVLVAMVLLLTQLSTIYLRRSWGEPGLLFLPPNLIYNALANGFLLGLALAATAVIGPLDDELISYQVMGFGVETTPLGVLIALPGLVFFWAALVFYAIVAWLDEHLSLSVVIALLACALVTVTFIVVSPPERRMAVTFLAGNFVFFGFLWGWLLGSLRRRVFEH